VVPERPAIKNFRRKALSLSDSELVEVGFLNSESMLPLVIKPALLGVDLVTWAANNQELVAAYLLKHGGILFRGFELESVDDFERLIEAISGELLEYVYASTPRRRVKGRIYTSTDYPADQSIPLHNEMSYARSWPGTLWLHCVQPAEQGGETPIADSRRVFARIDPQIRQRFTERGVMYVRTYGAGLDLSWQTVFQTESKNEVEDYCRRADIEFEWKDNNCLRTRQVCQAVVTHPNSGENVWFNQAHLFHISSLPTDAQKALRALFSKEEDCPRNAFYGDGSYIEASILNEIRNAYRCEAVSFPWRKGDVLMLDNMLAAHGRAPFLGSRKVVVGMAGLSGCQNLNKGQGV
jgi:alpha-ketoglutarate-dependent taurine dioxygenase